MNRELAEVGGRIDAIFFCPHGPDDGCRCRKPLPGMFETIADRYGIDLAEAHLVGDSLRDLQAGVAVGCKPHFVQTGKAARLDAAELAAVQSAVPQAEVHADLAAFVHELLHDERHRARRCRRARFGVRGALMALRPRRVPLGAVLPVPRRHDRAVGDGRGALFDLRPRRARLLGLRRLAARLDLGRARDLRRARPGAGLREPARLAGRDAARSTSRPGRRWPSRR